jgi:hypothetical protein
LGDNTRGFGPNRFTATRFPDIIVDTSDEPADIGLEFPEEEEDDQEENNTGNSDTCNKTLANTTARAGVVLSELL